MSPDESKQLKIPHILGQLVRSAMDSFAHLTESMEMVQNWPPKLYKLPKKGQHVQALYQTCSK